MFFLRFASLSLLRAFLTGNVEVVGGDGVAEAGGGDEIRNVEPGFLGLEHLVRGRGDLPVGGLDPEQVGVSVRVRRVLGRGCWSEPSWMIVSSLSSRDYSALESFVPTGPVAVDVRVVIPAADAAPLALKSRITVCKYVAGWPCPGFMKLVDLMGCKG